MRLWITILMFLAGGSAASSQAPPRASDSLFSWETVGTEPYDIRAFIQTQQGIYSLCIGGQKYCYLDSDFNVAQLNLPWGGESIFLTQNQSLLTGSRIYRSVNNGTSWTESCGLAPAPECEGPDRPNAFFQLPPGHPHAGRILAGTNLYSDDDGITWATSPIEGPWPNEGVNIVHFTLLPSGRLLAAAEFWGLLSSDDGGASWQVTSVYAPFRYAGYGVTALATPGSVQSGAPACGLPNPALCEGAVAIGTDAQDAFNRVWWTNDGGRSWTQGTPLEQIYDGVSWAYVANVFDRGLDPETGLGRALAVLGRGFVFITRDGGQTWERVARVPILPPDADVKVASDAEIGPDGRLYVAVRYNGPAREWLYRTIEPVDAAFIVAGEAPPVAGALALTVSPNPAEGTVTVRLDASAGAVAAVEVVDAVGRRVVTLHDGPVTGGGLRLPLSTAGWAAGVYVVRATSGASSATARLVVGR